MISFNNLYDYNKQAVSEKGKFDIQPLSENGLNRYFSNDSFNHKFLGKVNDLMLSQLENEEKDRSIRLGKLNKTFIDSLSANQNNDNLNHHHNICATEEVQYNNPEHYLSTE